MGLSTPSLHRESTDSLIPSDSLPRVYTSLLPRLNIVLQIVLCGLIVFTAVLLALYLCFRKIYIIVLVLVALVSWKILHKHFKDTKKFNLLVVLNLPISLTLWTSYILSSDRSLHIVLDFVSLSSFGLLYVALFLIPKIMPPLWRWIETSTVLSFKFICSYNYCRTCCRILHNTPCHFIFS